MSEHADYSTADELTKCQSRAAKRLPFFRDYWERVDVSVVGLAAKWQYYALRRMCNRAYLAGAKAERKRKENV